MEKKLDKKFTWVIKNFSSLQTEKIYSDQFIVGGCKWRLFAYPKGYKVDNSLSLFLEVPDYASLPSGWRRHAKYLLTIANQIPGKPSHTKEIQHWFDDKSNNWGLPVMLTLNELHAKDSGYLVNGELKIVVEIDILEIIGKVDVNGFQILPSQVELVSRIFEKYPEIAAEFRPKNPNLRTGCMNLLLGLIDTLRQLPRELPKDDLNEAYVALGYLTDAGFKLDWLKKKFDQASDTKEIEEAGEIRVQEIDKELKDSKQKFSDLEAQLEKGKAEMLASIDKELKDLKQKFSILEAQLGKEKAEVLAAKVPLSFDDVI